MGKFKLVLKIALFILIIYTVFLVNNSLIIKKILYPLKYENYIIEYSEANNLDPYLVAAVINVESRYREDVVSHKGAIGLMQIMVGTGDWIAEELQVKDYDDSMLFNPETNIMFGCWYLNNLKIQFGDDLEVFLAAYNGGSGNVENWLKDKEYSSDGRSLDTIPFRETRLYVKRVLANYPKYKEIYKNVID